MRVTIADIASELGLSKSTISIGLRDDRRLPDKTRNLIRETAARMGYRPDPVLAGIASRRWRHREKDRGLAIALIDNRTDPAPHTRWEYLSSAASRLDALGYHTARFDLDAQPTVAATNRILIARGIRGLVVPPVYRDDLLDGIDLSRFALAAAGIALWRPSFPSASLDVFEGMLLAVRKIVEYGYRRIGVVSLEHKIPLPDDARRAGATAVARDRYAADGVEVLSWTARIGLQAESIQAFLEWFRATKPDAVLCLNEFARNWLRAAKEPIPPDLGFAVLNRLEKSTAIAGVDPQHRRIGEAAADLLDQAITHHRLGPSADPPPVLTIPPAWLDGPSLPDLRNHQRASRGRKPRRRG